MSCAKGGRDHKSWKPSPFFPFLFESSNTNQERAKFTLKTEDDNGSWEDVDLGVRTNISMDKLYLNLKKTRTNIRQRNYIDVYRP